MAHIAVLMYPEAGHLLPTLRLSSRLQDVGHRVTYVSTRFFRASLTRLGFGFQEIFAEATRRAPADAGEPRGDPCMAGLELWKRVGALRAVPLQAGVRAIVRSAARELSLAVAGCQPDLLLCDAKIVASCRDLFAATFPSRTIALWTELPLEEDLACPELVLCPSALEIPGLASASVHRRYCEPSIFRSPPLGPEEVLGRLIGRQIVYCSLGTQEGTYSQAPRVLSEVLAAFSGSQNFGVVLSAGQWFEHPALSRPENNVFIQKRFNQQAVLRHASVAILHGGLGGIKESIVANVPMVIVPFAFDQPDNARRVEYHGLGTVCHPADVRAETIVSAAEAAIQKGNDGSLEAMRTEFEHMEEHEPALRAVIEAIGR